MSGLVILLVVGGIGLLLIFWLIGLYNSIKRKQIAANTGWADIDVQLKRRYDLIPNLVNTVKGYAAHEKGTLEAVISARNAAVSAKGVAEQAGAENVLTQALGRLFAVAEAYPQLKANENFMQLQEELTSTENKIGFSRQNYNRLVNQYNEAIALFPANMVSGIFNFAPMEFFELENQAQREAPQVQF